MGNVTSSQRNRRHKLVITECGHHSGVLTLLNQMRENEELTNFSIHVADKIIPCHKAVLVAAGSTKIQKDEKSWTNHDSITLTDVKAECVRQVIDYIYTSNIKIVRRNLTDIKTIAKKFELCSLLKACEHFSTSKRSKMRSSDWRHFCDVSNAEGLVSRLDGMRKTSYLTDTVIQVQGREFPCHRAMLASCSKYFKAMFTSEMHEKCSTRICLSEVQSDIFDILLDFIYTSRFVLQPSNMQEVLVTANYLQLHSDKLLEICTNSLLEKLTPSNCLQILGMSPAFLSPRIDQAAVKMVIAHFSKLYKSKDFLALSKYHLIQVISDDNLDIHEEDTVLDAVIKWISCEKSRESDADEVLSHVRFPFIDKKYLETMKTTQPQILQSPNANKADSL